MRRWTLILGGEHTDMQGVASRVAQIVGREVLRADLSVPTGNADISGRLRGTDFRPWPFDAVLNRGGSVSASRPADRVLLSGDGWWAEPDIGEWLWAGDYIWQRGDRRGRLGLVVAVDDGGARFVVIGDNSSFINRMIIADPRPVLRLLDMSTLWPSFSVDMALLTLSLLTVARVAHVYLLIPGIFIVMSIAAPWWSRSPSLAWEASYVGESGFNERNFNISLAEEPKLWKSGWVIIRKKEPIKGRVRLNIHREVLFLLVDDEVVIGNTKLHGCHRLGSIPEEGGTTLMDAQACAVDGDAEILLGNRDSAAALAIREGDKRAIVVLDTAFLSQVSPTENRNSILRWMTDRPQ